MGEGVGYPPGVAQEWLARHVFTAQHGAAFWGALLGAVVAFALLIVGLQLLDSATRRRVTVICTFVAGLFYLLSFFLPPGSDVDGRVELGGAVYQVDGQRSWVHGQRVPPPSPDAEDEPAPADAPPPGTWVPTSSTIQAELKLHPAPVTPPAPGAAEPSANPTLSGRSEAGGPWSFTLTTAAGEVPLTPAGDSRYTFTLDGRPAVLTLDLPPALNVLKAYETPLGSFLLVMGAFTIGLGVINLTAVHGRVLVRARPGWPNSLAFFVGFLGMSVLGIWSMYQPEAAPGATTVTPVTAAYTVFFEGLLVPLQSTTFALLGFFIVSAAYRAFRIRSTEAALMTVIAFVVMLGQVPVGQLLTAWLPATGPLAALRLENITNWLLTNPNTAAFRGILFGAATGGFALSLRVWLSLERGSYFGKEY